MKVVPTPLLLAAMAVAAALLVAVASPAPAAGAGDTQPGSTSEGRAAALLWGGQFFLKQDDFEEWLRLRNKDYETWSALHPAAQEILEGAVANPPQLEGAGSSGGADAGRSSGSSTEWLLLALGVAAACALALSTIPVRRLLPNPAVAEFFEEKRIAVSALGIGVLVGVAVAKLLA